MMPDSGNIAPWPLEIRYVETEENISGYYVTSSAYSYEVIVDEIEIALSSEIKIDYLDKNGKIYPDNYEADYPHRYLDPKGKLKNRFRITADGFENEKTDFRFHAIIMDEPRDFYKSAWYEYSKSKVKEIEDPSSVEGL